MLSHSVTSNSLQPCGFVAHQALLSMGFSGQDYWGALPFSPPGNLPDPEIKPISPAYPAGLPLSHLGSPKVTLWANIFTSVYIYSRRGVKKNTIQKRKKYNHFKVHCSIIYNSQDMEATKGLLTDEWIRKNMSIYMITQL